MVDQAFSLSSNYVEVVGYCVVLPLAYGKRIEKFESYVVYLHKHLKVFRRHIVYIEPVSEILYLLDLAA